jgi:hypothetical protein
VQEYLATGKNPDRRNNTVTTSTPQEDDVPAMLSAPASAPQAKPAASKAVPQSSIDDALDAVFR